MGIHERIDRMDAVIQTAITEIAELKEVVPAVAAAAQLLKDQVAAQDQRIADLTAKFEAASGQAVPPSVDDIKADLAALSAANAELRQVIDELRVAIPMGVDAAPVDPPTPAPVDNPAPVEGEAAPGSEQPI